MFESVCSIYLQRNLSGTRDEAIFMYDTLLLVLSERQHEQQLGEGEIDNAQAREDQQKRQMLFPVRSCPFDLVKGWKLFDTDRRLLRDLKAGSRDWAKRWNSRRKHV